MQIFTHTKLVTQMNLKKEKSDKHVKHAKSNNSYESHSSVEKTIQTSKQLQMSQVQVHNHNQL